MYLGISDQARATFIGSSNIIFTSLNQGSNTSVLAFVSPTGKGGNLTLPSSMGGNLEFDGSFIVYAGVNGTQYYLQAVNVV
jgi:hypothetical protein